MRVGDMMSGIGVHDWSYATCLVTVIRSSTTMSKAQCRHARQPCIACYSFTHGYQVFLNTSQGLLSFLPIDDSLVAAFFVLTEYLLAISLSAACFAFHQYPSLVVHNL